MAEKITGYTSEMCQQAMMDELEELFRDMKFTGQEGEKPLKIYKQFLPTQTDDEVTRYLMEVDGTTVIDIDKFAGRYYVDGEDMRAEINALI